MAQRMALSFFGVGLSGSSNSASLLADRIVAAIKMATFLSSVTGGSALDMRERMSLSSSYA